MICSAAVFYDVIFHCLSTQDEGHSSFDKYITQTNRALSAKHVQEYAGSLTICQSWRRTGKQAETKKKSQWAIQQDIDSIFYLNCTYIGCLLLLPIIENLLLKIYQYYKNSNNLKYRILKTVFNDNRKICFTNQKKQNKNDNNYNQFLVCDKK